MGILYVSGSFVSSRHLKFEPVTSDVAVLEVLGINGAFVEGLHVKKGHRCYVRAGDCIEIGAYKIVWTGKENTDETPFMGFAGKIKEPESVSVEIEGPPQRKVPEKPSVMLAAGPALTMAIPILLGAGKTLAILSSILAAGWAAANVIGRVKKQKTEEKRRRNTYLSYLSECRENIVKREKIIRSELCLRYPTVGDYLRDGGNPLLLWNDVGIEEKLKIRLGIGTIRNPLNIVIPKERFATVDDSLKELPKILRKKHEMLSNVPVLADLTALSPVAFVIKNDKDICILSAFILQIAVSGSPQCMALMVKLDDETMQSLVWTRLLPHYKEDNDRQDETLYTVVITDDPANAYNAASRRQIAVLVLRADRDPPVGVTVLYPSADSIGKVRFDPVHPKLCHSYAAMMSRLWKGHADKREMPSSVPFGRLFDIRMTEDAGCDTVETFTKRIIDNYGKNNITECFAAPIGITAQGEKLYLDLHERAAGPHGVIAGTTGSGKSELLTTMILSFSANHPPDKLAFFLIDYKGGGMSGLFGDLPHLIGSISNLSGVQSKRAMIALRSENIRRQKIFAESGVNNINDYTKLYDAGLVNEPLPHVLIIVDEFAELKKEEPDFMDSLISVAQVGRSLGMHLILATQRPSGVVDDKIRSNSRFRIALRLVDRSDSMDMLQRADATTIRECGRAYLQVGNDEVFELFQSGYAMGSADSGNKGLRIYEDLLCRNELYAGPEDKTKDEDAITWYEIAMKAISAASGQYDAGPSPLCLPELPENICDRKAYAIFDNPYKQKYEKACYDPAEAGHILICGRSGSGKSELVKTLIRRTDAECAVYIVDHGGGRLKCIMRSRSCGGYIGEGENDDILRLTWFIRDELVKRRNTIASCGGKSHTILLVLDDINTAKKNADPEALEHITQILALGAGVGIYVIATCMILPENKYTRLFNKYLFMGNEDVYSVSALLGGSPRDIPHVRSFPGRGVGIKDGMPLEFQAVMTNDPQKEDDNGIRAVMFPTVPAHPALDDLFCRVSGESHNMDIPAGFEQRSGKLFFLPAGEARCILIGGKQYTGRHTFLFNISITSARYGIKCVRADTYEALEAICRSAQTFTIVAVNSMTALLEEFYDKKHSIEDEDELASYFENPMTYKRDPKNNILIIGILDNNAAVKFAGRKIYESMVRHPYAISLGGCLDENRNFDFSYMPYSAMQKAKKRFHATVLRYDEKHFFGDIIIPGKTIVDNSQTQINRGLVTHDID